ncbi:Csu type fimbrial protein [Kosakonia sacchari]|uniref:Spore coat protein U (SCPU) domain-containing protein n=1 Tax=Kosakonia sacchari TaxID=1158459 RepID=A0A1G4ZA36_9ENTR|nr:spore coat U domain-containing protein [Kosakonia sacchari]AHJ77381.1 hypothetical protein C813_23690 [Kosakonia sacchari SP1]SCX62493.1 Spore coat protein U (SCPU) domain-containing protein [Kosakonia sacchari]
MKRYLLCFYTLLSLPFAASAVTATGTLQVQAVVQSTCSVNTTSTGATGPARLNFGTITNLTADVTADTTSGTVANGAVSTLCSTGTAWTLTADGGLHASSSQRQMADTATGLLPYNLYSDAAHSSSIGINDAQNPVATGTGTGSAETTPVYGLIPAGTPMPEAGSYADTVTLTVTY